MDKFSIEGFLGLKLEDEKPLTVYLKGIDYPLLIIKKTFVNEDASRWILYLVTNDLSLENDQYI